jgi:esterase
MLAYNIRGNGPKTAFLLHGFLGSGRNLGSLARRWLEENPAQRLILPDLTGHGESPPLPARADVATMAADVLALADFLHVPKPLVLVGHSLGGRVALAARLLQPAAVGQIVLLDISPAPVTRIADGLHSVLERLLSAPATVENREDMRDFFLAGGVSAPLTDWVLMNLLHEGGYYRWRIDRPALGAFHERSTPTDLWGALGGDGLQACCIRGALSHFVSDADAARLKQVGCPVQTLADAGHFVHVDQQAALLAALVAAV